MNTQYPKSTLPQGEAEINLFEDAARALAIERSARELLEEVIAERDGFYLSCTNDEGEYDPGEEGQVDKAKVEHLDAIIDRARAALGDV